MIQRKTLFGFPVPQRPASTYTWRAVPLTHGAQLNQPWPLLPAGSGASMTNLWPLDGCLVPRSRLSSVNTLRVLPAINGLAEATDATFGSPWLWMSGTTQHAVLASNGSISRASFTSAFGQGAGTGPVNGGSVWQYAQTFFGTLGTGGENALVAASNSNETLLVLYRVGGAFNAAPAFSYLTSAPKAAAVASFNNYVIAWNINSVTPRAPTRVQWCVRGSPSNWTSEGSGFEDLLDMRGSGTAVRPLSNDRFALFSDQEIWQGLGAAYPAQFQFLPLDPQVGCAAVATIQRTNLGYLFLGTDGTIRLLPEDGSPSRIVSDNVSNIVRRGGASQSWAVFDPLTRLYHLFLNRSTRFDGLSIHIDTGVCGFTAFMSNTTDAPQRGVAVTPTTGTGVYVGNEGLFFANSTGTVFSTNSLLSSDTHGSAATATWRSGPIAPDLPGNYKQLTKVCLDYRATSRSTVTLKISQDGGNNYEATGRALSLGSAPASGRVESDLYIGSAYPTIELTSVSTGFELHRLDVSMNLGGRK